MAQIEAGGIKIGKQIRGREDLSKVCFYTGEKSKLLSIDDLQVAMAFQRNILYFLCLF